MRVIYDDSMTTQTVERHGADITITTVEHLRIPVASTHPIPTPNGVGPLNTADAVRSLYA